MILVARIFFCQVKFYKTQLTKNQNKHKDLCTIFRIDGYITMREVTCGDLIFVFTQSEVNDNGKFPVLHPFRCPLFLFRADTQTPFNYLYIINPYGDFPFLKADL